MSTKHFLIEEKDIASLEALAKRLHTEERMDGNAMRDYGHALATIAKRSRQIEVPSIE